MSVQTSISSHNAAAQCTPDEAEAALSHFHPTLRRWFSAAFAAPTRAQALSWPEIAKRSNTLLLAPTGSGKTLAAFLVAIDRIMFQPTPEKRGVRILYISPLKALGVDVQRNLNSPLAGARVAAEREGQEYFEPRVGVRSGDTPSAERQRMVREPPEILITTPESLYLLLTSRARETLAQVDTVIIDEIHSMVGSKRGSHLFLSLERLERLRSQSNPTLPPLQRIGLSATQRPLEEVARLLGGGHHAEDDDNPTPRPVQIVEAKSDKHFDLKIEVPVEDMARLAESIDAKPVHNGPAAAGPTIPSIWPSIHPRLVELIRSHRSTMIFVNSRRLAERLANSINELAEEEIALAHHGSIAKDTRAIIEDRLKRGNLPAIVATSSLELGIDMGAVDLVIQIEAPPSIASGIQRIGRAGHQVGASSSGVIFPKYRGDLLACSAATERMVRGEVEEMFYPRNPLDVLAQQIVAIVSMETIADDELFKLVRSAAPFAELPRSSFESVLDLLAGRYPSDEFAELRPRINWDRLSGEITARKGAQRIAIVNAGTIPDRGLYAVFLSNGDAAASRVGELDEEMVFETRPGEVFLLGASSWRVMDITHDRVLVSPAPGEPGRMPFWRGEGPGRPLEFGRAIGKLTRELLAEKRASAEERLTARHSLDNRAARNLVDYLDDQSKVTEEPPSDKTIVVESFLDEVGDWRVVILSPFGARVHAPWATAVGAKLRADAYEDIDMVWTDDGIVFRLPESDRPPATEELFPKSEEIEDLVVRELGTTAMFAARFRENAARALLLPRRRPGQRTPLWQQRRRSADLLKVAAKYKSFPILLETYRECLRDIFDIRGLKNLLRDIERRAIRVRTVETQVASPFASALMFNFTANFLYDGDAPLAERRAQTLALDHTQLRELLGDAELRSLLDADAIDDLSLELQWLDQRYQIKHKDALHDMLLRLGDLDSEEIAHRTMQPFRDDGNLDRWIDELIEAKRIIKISVGGDKRFIAAEDASRYRDTVGVVPPIGLPDAFLETVNDPVADLVSRYARTHVPFLVDDVAKRYGIAVGPVRQALARLANADRVVEGEFLPGGRHREWCSTEVLRTLKRRSLAKLRKQVEPVSTEALARFLPRWQGVAQPRRGLDGLLDTIDQLQGIPLPATTLEHHILPQRVRDFQMADLDELCSAGEVIWRGHESIGTGDGRVSLYLADNLPLLAPDSTPIEFDSAKRIVEILSGRGAIFFDELTKELGGFPNDVIRDLWDLVWAGYVTNDTLAPLRSLRASNSSKSKAKMRSARRRFRSRRAARIPGTEGRWSLVHPIESIRPTSTERLTAIAKQLIERYGVLTREMVTSEGIAGGFSALYPILKVMEESGKLRRGYFVTGMGAAQFAALGADDRIRNEGEDALSTEPIFLAACDPANPYGAAVRWPATEEGSGRPQRNTGSMVLLQAGSLIAYLGRSGESLITFDTDDEMKNAARRRTIAECLADLATEERAVYISKINGSDPATSPMSEPLTDSGFVLTSKGFLHRRKREGRSDQRAGR